MLVSTNMRYVAGVTRSTSRRPDELYDSEVRQAFEKSTEERRSANFARPRRQTVGRFRDSEEARPSLARFTPQGKAAPFSSVPRQTDFWSLLGAVTPETAPAAETEQSPTLPQEPSLGELLAQVMASH